MLRQSELCKPISVQHGRFVDVNLLREFFRSLKPGEDKFRLFYWLLLETGMRVKEACAVQLQDFTPDYRKLRLVTCKNPKMRQVTLSPYLSAFLRRWCEYNTHLFQYGYIFPCVSKRYSRLYPFHLRRFLSTKRKELGMKPIQVYQSQNIIGYGKITETRRYQLEHHSFRRFYETNLTNLANGNYMLIASLMQYDDPSIVRKYYEDATAVKQEEQLAQKYHQVTVSAIIQDRPLTHKNQKQLNQWTD